MFAQGDIHCPHGNHPFNCPTCGMTQAQSSAEYRRREVYRRFRENTRRAQQFNEAFQARQDWPEAERVDDEVPKLLKGE